MPFVDGKKLQHLELWIMLRPEDGFVWQPGWNTDDNNKDGFQLTIIDYLLDLAQEVDKRKIMEMSVGQVHVSPDDKVWRHENQTKRWTANRVRLDKHMLVKELPARQMYTMLNGYYLDHSLPPFRATKKNNMMKELIDRLSRLKAGEEEDLNSLRMLLFLRSGYTTIQFMQFREFRELVYYYSMLFHFLAHFANCNKFWCLLVVSNNGFMIQAVKDQFLEACLAAVKNYPKAIKYVKPKFQDACRDYINNNNK